MSNLPAIFISVKGRSIIKIILLGSLLSLGLATRAQDPMSRFRGMGQGMGSSGKTDTLQHRKADTITINFRYLDSSRLQKQDSSIFDFSRRVPPPPTYINLGNNGTPARDLVFSPRMKSGWDLGWHAYDVYVFNTEETKFYNTTKPFTEIGYLLGGKTEQIIDLLHTQNIRPNWNFAFEYRLINSPGTFQNQNSNHNNYRLSSWYQSKNKRYQAFFILVGSKLQASDNGGIKDIKQLDSISYTDRSTLPVILGNNLALSSGNPFSSNVSTGTRYTTGTYLLRQQYDLGQKDSTVVNDSTVIPLFYPRLRLEHTFAYTTYHYRYGDQPRPTSYLLDSNYYADHYNLNYIHPTDTLFRETRWKDMTNDFSFYTFPDAKNPQQFLKLGGSLQLLTGVSDTGRLANGSIIDVTRTFNEYNAFLHGEYRNKTKNQKWDIEAFGKFYLNGVNAGDYNAYVSLKRYISKKLGYLQLGFENVNRSPSFVFDRASPFYYDTARQSYNKENTTHLFASLDQPQNHLRIEGAYYLISNYSYFTDYFKQRQQGALFNILQVSVRKQFTIHGPWKWRTMAMVQQVAGSSPVHVPNFLSTNQVGYDGSFGFKNLNISFGAEIRYYTGYQADGYAPATGQFYTQSDTTIRQHVPDITGYLHFRIRTFVLYVRAENLNSVRFGPNGFGFTNNNFVAPNYPSPGMLLRFGIFWDFIN